MKPVYLLVGCPASGKSWVCHQLSGKGFVHVEHDQFIGHLESYLAEIFLTAKSDVVLAEAPFSISQIKDPLEMMGVEVIPVVIVEDPLVIMARYAKRENKPIPMGHISRQRTYESRSKEFGWFRGTSVEALSHLRKVAGSL